MRANGGIAPGGDNLTVLDNHRPYRNLTCVGSRLRLLQRQPHKTGIVYSCYHYCSYLAFIYGG